MQQDYNWHFRWDGFTANIEFIGKKGIKPCTIQAIIQVWN